MESQAGRVVANELAALARGEGDHGEAAYGALDEVGRDRLTRMARRFHESCAKVSQQDELLALQWRVQSMEEKRLVAPEGVGERSSDPVVGLAPGSSDATERLSAGTDETSSEPVVGLAPRLSAAAEQLPPQTGSVPADARPAQL